MKEVKQRGKRLDNGEWIYGNLCHGENNCYIVYDNDFYTFNDSCGEHLIADRFCEVIPETLGWYTGLKDKNGKEIYEGDIIRIYDKKIRTVFAVPGGFAVESLDTDIGKYGKEYIPIESLADKQNQQFIKAVAKVIGNIYENQGLLDQH